MSHAAYEVVHPKQNSSCVVFASPHSGCDYSFSFLRASVLDGHTIRSSEDAFVDLLFASAARFGAPFLKAGAPRAFIDLNRSCDELDPALIEGVRRQGHNPRIASGLGVIPRVVANGRAMGAGAIGRVGRLARRGETSVLFGLSVLVCRFGLPARQVNLEEFKHVMRTVYHSKKPVRALRLGWHAVSRRPASRHHASPVCCVDVCLDGQDFFLAVHFRALDTDNSGTLCFDELKKHLTGHYSIAAP